MNLAYLHPAVQASYLVMMYISVFPIAISVRRTNVYEEKSLGIYSQADIDERANGTDLEYVGAHLRRQLSFDLWYLFIGFFILAISEGPRIQNGDFSMFAVLFEIVSAYGTVGLSLGYPNVDASLCSQFTVVGKLVILAMMIRGRHRGLPYGLDRAILLPSESLNVNEAADANARAPRRSSVDPGTATTAPAGRGTGATSARRRSMSIDRVNGNFFTQFLHPGPAIPHEPVSHAPPLKRVSSDPIPEETTAGERRATAPRRAETFANAPSTSAPRRGRN